MPGEVERMTDEEIVKWQEELYELEPYCSTSPPMTEDEKMEKIKAFLADDYFEKLNALIPARRKELEQEIATEKDPKKKARLQRNLEQLGEFEMPARLKK